MPRDLEVEDHCHRSWDDLLIVLLSQLFREILSDQDDDKVVGNVHLNPASHWMAVNRGPRQEGDGADLRHHRRRRLSVCVLGITNAGKSTLVNALCGFSACPYSAQ